LKTLSIWLSLAVVAVAEMPLLCVQVAAALAAIAVLWLAKIQEEPRQQKLN
jgi:hypothetical protein